MINIEYVVLQKITNLYLSNLYLLFIECETNKLFRNFC